MISVIKNKISICKIRNTQLYLILRSRIISIYNLKNFDFTVQILSHQSQVHDGSDADDDNGNHHENHNHGNDYDHDSGGNDHQSDDNDEDKQFHLKNQTLP